MYQKLKFKNFASKYYVIKTFCTNCIIYPNFAKASNISTLKKYYNMMLQSRTQSNVTNGPRPNCRDQKSSPSPMADIEEGRGTTTAVKPRTTLNPRPSGVIFCSSATKAFLVLFNGGKLGMIYCWFYLWCWLSLIVFLLHVLMAALLCLVNFQASVSRLYIKFWLRASSFFHIM